MVIVMPGGGGCGDGSDGMVMRLLMVIVMSAGGAGGVGSDGNRDVCWWW